ncbi:MAG TPA: hypothetical protein VHP31_07810 [Caproicibacter sp.]|nr:hypothetical protein [Caproicibacter sp.]
MDYMTWIIIAVIVVGVLIYCLIPNKTEYECPHCKARFVPSKLKLVVSGHVGSKHFLVCPHCGKRSAIGPAPKSDKRGDD